MIIAVLGVVFGDIGTSPLYVLRACFAGPHAIALTPAAVLGCVSLIFWFLILIVSIKYVIFVMHADNKGEGGILALMALVRRIGSDAIRRSTILPFLGILGAALLFSDGAITPAISVLSALEGLQVAAPIPDPLIILASVAVLTGLFALQPRGTSAIGAIFGPFMLLWFATMAVLGAAAIAANPGIIRAINPLYALELLRSTGWKSFALLGGAFLAVTGAEVLYADIGHFGKTPIRKAWFGIVFPALILNYFGQGAFLLRGGQTFINPFYQIAPAWFLYPLVIIATMATIIASQAMISGAFSLVRQATQLGFWPRVRVVHTSRSHFGQVYLPLVNIALFIVTSLLVIGFRKSGNLASAYGIAISADMLLTTCMITLLARNLWKGPMSALIPLVALFWIIDGSLFAANCIKIPSGGWVVIVLAGVVCTLMLTWVSGRAVLRNHILTESLPLEPFVQDIAAQRLVRIRKTGIFLSGSMLTVPRALLHNYKHNGILHTPTIIVFIMTEEMPFVSPSGRCVVTDLGQKIYRVVIRYGFMESPHIPTALESLDIPDVPKDGLQLSYFLGKESLVLVHGGAMRRWQKQLFLFMTRNAQSASSFFNLPPNRVVELGVQIEF
jgi:KUP system potassium uptake protein